MTARKISLLVIGLALSGCALVSEAQLLRKTPEERAAAKASAAAAAAVPDPPRSEYDKFKNRTLVQVDGIFQKDPAGRSSWWAAYSYEGQPRTNKPRPVAVTFAIFTYRGDWMFLKRSREAIFLTDTQRFTGNYDHKGDVSVVGSGQYSSVQVAEQMTVIIEPAEFRALALSTKPVEFSLGGYAFEFGPKGMNSLRALLETFESASPILPGTNPSDATANAVPGTTVEVSTMSGTRSLLVGGEVVLVLVSGIEIPGVFVGTADEHIELLAGGETKRIKVVELKDARTK